MNTILGLAMFGIIIMIALFLGQILISIIFGLLMVVGTAIVGAVTGIVNLFKGRNK